MSRSCRGLPIKRVHPGHILLVTVFAHEGSSKNFYRRDVSYSLKLHLCEDSAYGLDSLHQTEFAHRDLELNNVLIGHRAGEHDTDSNPSLLILSKCPTRRAVLKHPLWWHVSICGTDHFSNLCEAHNVDIRSLMLEGTAMAMQLQRKTRVYRVRNQDLLTPLCRLRPRLRISKTNNSSPPFCFAFPGAACQDGVSRL